MRTKWEWHWRNPSEPSPRGSMGCSMMERSVWGVGSSLEGAPPCMNYSRRRGQHNNEGPLSLRGPSGQEDNTTMRGPSPYVVHQDKRTIQQWGLYWPGPYTVHKICESLIYMLSSVILKQYSSTITFWILTEELPVIGVYLNTQIEMYMNILTGTLKNGHNVVRRW